MLNNSLKKQLKAPDELRTDNGRECSKKHALSLSEGSIQQGRSHFDARSVHFVREHGKMARTPLAAFFNIPLHYRYPLGDLKAGCGEVWSKYEGF